MMTKGGRGTRERTIAEVSLMLRQALNKLDEINAPPDIGAHVDRALCRLAEIV